MKVLIEHTGHTDRASALKMRRENATIHSIDAEVTGRGELQSEGQPPEPISQITSLFDSDTQTAL